MGQNSKRSHESISKSSKNISGLFLVPQAAKFFPNNPSLWADYATYHYPSRFDEIYNPLLFAAQALKPNGHFVARTEISEVFRKLCSWLNGFVVKAGKFNADKHHVSLYDMVYGRRSYFQIEAVNKDGGLLHIA